MTRHILDNLIHIMKRLRSENGCPWDKEQTHDSIKRYILEEAYELIEAIDENDTHKMKDELGDILFQVIFHCQLASENKSFTIEDVIKNAEEKMIRRHPHVFSDKKLSTPDEVIDQWDKIKQTEHAHRHRTSVLDGVPTNMPSLMRADKVQKKAAKTGFDWDKPEHIIDKIQEELYETTESLKEGDRKKIAEEIGDLFFAVANLARFLKFDPEELSRKSVDKFIKRFKQVEQELASRGKHPQDSTLAEMDDIWNANKTTKKK